MIILTTLGLRTGNSEYQENVAQNHKSDEKITFEQYAVQSKIGQNLKLSQETKCYFS